MSTRSHAGNIPSATAEHELTTTFSRFDPAESADVAMNPITGRGRDFPSYAYSMK